MKQQIVDELNPRSGKIYSGAFWAAVTITLLIVGGCETNRVVKSLENTSFTLVNQDSEKVVFPTDFEGRPMVVGYIFTHCRNVCPAITANMKTISQKLSPDQQVQFVLVSFDPKRDDPARLRAYRRKFDLDPQRFTLLTGDSAEIHALMDTVGVRVRRVPDTTGQNTGYGFIHTNQINLFDRRGRIRREYGGSMVPPKHVIADLKKLQ